jgi:hypothetical protein
LIDMSPNPIPKGIYKPIKHIIQCLHLRRLYHKRIAESTKNERNRLTCAVQQLEPLKGCICALLWRVILDLVYHDVAFVCWGSGW